MAICHLNVFVPILACGQTPEKSEIVNLRHCWSLQKNLPIEKHYRKCGICGNFNPEISGFNQLKSRITGLKDRLGFHDRIPRRIASKQYKYPVLLFIRI
jgi:hypothetical protein